MFKQLVLLMLVALLVASNCASAGILSSLGDVPIVNNVLDTVSDTAGGLPVVGDLLDG